VVSRRIMFGPRLSAARSRITEVVRRAGLF
jgi:hypothetical protein